MSDLPERLRELANLPGQCDINSAMEEAADRIELLEVLLASVHREYVGYADPEPQTDEQAIQMMMAEFADELPIPTTEETT